MGTLLNLYRDIIRCSNPSLYARYCSALWPPPMLSVTSISCPIVVVVVLVDGMANLLIEIAIDMYK